MRRSHVTTLVPLLVLSCFCWNEFLVYYVSFWLSCQWPAAPDGQPPPTKQAACLRTLVLSDTHILGRKRGHFFDRLRREWQMYRSFVTADTLFQPDAVLVLGDLLDEGLIASDEDFAAYVQRFHSVIPIREQTKSIVLVGNHDIGFHDRVLYFEPKLRQRFEKAFNASLVQVDHIPHSSHNYTFVSINSMALEGDGCSLCSQAEARVRRVGESLSRVDQRPILLSHFPLFRTSDESCGEADSADEEDKGIPFRPSVDCISEESSQLLISSLKPRLVLVGHTHNGCILRHRFAGVEVTEHTVASFSWRNRANPSFLLLSVCPTDVLVSKCFVPNEWLVILVYTGVSFAIMALGAWSTRSLDWSLEGKHLNPKSA